MLTNNDAKLINSLAKKKFRQKYNKFIVEGIKTVQEVLNSSWKVEKIYTVEDIFPDARHLCEFITETELKKISQLVQPNTVLAVCGIPKENQIQENGFIIGLDDIRDPGNLGTIIRMADWFGIEQIICSHETVDVYNPKVIQASMGSFTRVQINYVNLHKFLSHYRHTILGTFMEGENIYQMEFPQDALLLMGNEANGISPENFSLLNRKITIPRLGNKQSTESLNVAMATGIILGQRASQFFK